MSAHLELPSHSINSSADGVSPSSQKVRTSSSAAASLDDHSLALNLTYRLSSDKFAAIHTSGEPLRIGNSRASRLYDRFKAIYDMTRLPEEHPYHLPDDIANHAKTCLALLLNNSHLDVPQLINRGGEALSFTWRTEDGKVYVTIDDTDVDLLAILKEEDLTANLISDGHFDWAKLVSLLDIKSSSDVSR